MSLLKKLVWIGVAALGTWAVATLALSRGEKISAFWIVIAGFCALSISYRFYSKWLATKVLVLNEERATPAVLRNDNKDYVPTNRWMVFGHHFAAIAGPVEDHGLQVVVEDRARDTAEPGERLDVPAHEALERLVEGEPGEHRARPRQHHHEAGERSFRVPDADGAGPSISARTAPRSWRSSADFSSTIDYSLQSKRFSVEG